MRSLPLVRLSCIPTHALASYNFLVKHGWLWRLNFETTSHKVVHESIFGAFGAVAGATFAQAFDAICPDLVVSVHPLMQHVPLRVLAKRAKSLGAAPPPFATVVTDLTSCHPTWFHPAVDVCFVPTPQVASQAFAEGLKPTQVVMHGLPIRPAFAQRLPARRSLRRRLGLEPEGPAVLLMGGGEGMGSLEATAEALAGQLQPGAQVVVVCGRNAALAGRLSAKAAGWKVKVHVKGFLGNINEWMGACDLVITKAGPGTIAEALILGVPLLLNGAIPCQEEGNVPYVVDNKVGTYLTDPKAIAAQVAAWFGPARAELAEMASRAKRLGRPHATYDIVEDLKALCERRPVRAMA